MTFPRLTPQQYHSVTRVALWSLAVIVVSGAAVRLTGSGLGCSDWPNCEAGQLVPEADFHAWVEFGNRIITGLVSIAVDFGRFRINPAQPTRQQTDEMVFGTRSWSRSPDCPRCDNRHHSFITPGSYRTLLVVDGAHLERRGP